MIRAFVQQLSYTKKQFALKTFLNINQSYFRFSNSKKLQ